jgi:hypothetical protein
MIFPKHSFGMRTFFLVLTLTALCLSLHYYGPTEVDLPISLWSLQGETIYVASEIGVGVVSTTGEILGDIFVGEWIEEVYTTKDYLVVFTNTSNLLVYTIPDRKLYANTTIDQPSWKFAIVALRDFIVLLSDEKEAPESRTFADFYFYNTTFHTRVDRKSVV